MRLEFFGVVKIEVAEIGHRPDTAGRDWQSWVRRSTAVCRKHHADRKLDHDRVDVLALERIDRCAERESSELERISAGSCPIESHQIEKERVLARAGEYLDISCGNYVRGIGFWPGGTLGGKPFDNDVARKNRAEGLARCRRRRARRAIPERAEHKVDMCGRMRVRARCEVQPVKRVFLEVI